MRESLFQEEIRIFFSFFKIQKKTQLYSCYVFLTTASEHTEYILGNTYGRGSLSITTHEEGRVTQRNKHWSK